MMKKKNRTGLAGKVKRITAAALAGCMLYCGGVQADAATLKDVFDEQYYADMYPDLKEAFGYDREALWQHFISYGLSESRNMNSLIDIVKYREMYSDLDAAFGDDWNAYLNHYLTLGAKENRLTGTDFNPLDYAGRYEDIQAAFGTDVLALWGHYRAFGATEGREARDERIVQAEEAAARAEEEDSKTGRTERKDLSDGSWIIREYDSDDNLIKQTWYDKDGWVSCILERDINGNLIQETWYNSDGSIQRYSDVVERYDNGAIKKVILYQNDGSGFYVWLVQERDSDGNITETRYNADGTVQNR